MTISTLDITIIIIILPLLTSFVFNLLKHLYKILQLNDNKNYVEIILDWEKNRTAFFKSLKEKKNDR